MCSIGCALLTSQQRSPRRCARARWFSGAGGVARQLIGEVAVRRSDRADAETRLAVLLTRRIVASSPDDAEERLTISGEIVSLASAERRYEVALDAIRTCVLTLVELGRLDDADDSIELFVRRTELWREPLFSPLGPIFRAMRALQSGRLDDARVQLERASALADRTQSIIARQLIVMQQFSLIRWSAPDELEALIQGLELFAGRTGSGPAWRHALLRLLGDLGRWGDVTARLDRFERNGGGSAIGLTAGNNVKSWLGPSWLGSGRPYRLRLQIFPDGRCGAAVDGR